MCIFHGFADKYEYMDYRTCSKTGNDENTGSDGEAENGSSGTGSRYMLPPTVLMGSIIMLLSWTEIS